MHGLHLSWYLFAGGCIYVTWTGVTCACKTCFVCCVCVTCGQVRISFHHIQCKRFANEKQWLVAILPIHTPMMIWLLYWWKLVLVAMSVFNDSVSVGQEEHTDLSENQAPHHLRSSIASENGENDRVPRGIPAVFSSFSLWTWPLWQPHPWHAAGVEVPLLRRLLDNNLIPISGPFGADNRFFDAERVHI